MPDSRGHLPSCFNPRIKINSPFIQNMGERQGRTLIFSKNLSVEKYSRNKKAKTQNR